MKVMLGFILYKFLIIIRIVSAIAFIIINIINILFNFYYYYFFIIKFVTISLNP